MEAHDKAREDRQKRELTNLKVRHTNQDHYDRIRKLRAAPKRKPTVEDSVRDVLSGNTKTDDPEFDLDTVVLAEMLMGELETDDIDEAVKNDPLVAQIKAVGSNKKNLVMVIGNGINRLRTEKDDRGILILIGALGVLSSAGEDETLINLAKRLASAGLTSRGRR